MAVEEEEAKRILRAAAAKFLPPLHVVDDLLSSGVCVQCIFRLFGAHGHVYFCSNLTVSLLRTSLEEKDTSLSGTTENGPTFNGVVQYSNNAEESLHGQSCCSICLGILQFAYHHVEEMRTCEEGASLDDFTSIIAKLIKKENHQIDGFYLEVSVPPVIMSNERSIWLYLKRKYDSEEWFKKSHSEHISVKDALRSSITGSLENSLNVRSGSESFRVRLTYTHPELSTKLRSCLAIIGHGHKRRKTETEDSKDGFIDINGRNYKDSNEDIENESDAAIFRALKALQDNEFCERFSLPPEKTFKACQLTTTCYRRPIYISGRYLKYSRKVSQSRWIIDFERMGEASVEEIVGSISLLKCRGDNYKFHAAGREDIDVRMLGSGRPFLLEILNARCIPSLVDVQQIAETINNSEEKYVMVRNLKVVGSEVWNLMREGEAEKQKQYAALVWISRPLTEEDLQNISSIKDMDVLQRTPVRVLHRRSPLERKKMIHWMMVEKFVESSQYFLLHLCTQAGTYIKEFVHGDLGRTHPSIGSILGCRAEILQLDVTDVKMDSLSTAPDLKDNTSGLTPVEKHVRPIFMQKESKNDV